MARMIDAEWWNRADETEIGWVSPYPSSWPTIVESDQLGEWMNGGTWVALMGDDFTSSTEEFEEEVWRRAQKVNLGVGVFPHMSSAAFEARVVFRFRYSPMGERVNGEVIEFSKPMAAHDEETGEYMGYWWMPGGTRVEVPAGVSLTAADAA